MFRVTIEIDGKKMGVYELREGANVIGRSRGSDIKVDAPDISRAHAKITVSGGKAVVENLSQFGCKVDGAAFTAPVEISAGQRLSIGAMTSILFERTSGADAERVESAGRPDAPVSATRAAGADAMTVVAGGGDYARKTGAAVRAEAAADRTGADLPGAGGGGSEDAKDRTGQDAGGGTRDDDLAGEKEDSEGDHPRATEAASGRASGTRVSARSTGGDEGHTRAMQTQMISPEELEILRVIEQKRMRNRMMLGAVIGVPLVILALIFRPRPLPPENEIGWNTDAKGEYVDAFEPGPDGGAKQGGFDIFFPGGADRKVTPSPGAIRIETWVGRDRNVPLRLVLEEESDKRFVEMNRDDVVAEWIGKIKESREPWNPDRPLPVLGFYGLEQGIPYVRVPYQREGDGSWAGVACIFRHGQKRYVLRSEVPARERYRADKLVFHKFVNPSAVFLRSHWESSGEIPRTPEKDIMREARVEMARMAPATWAEIENLLKGALAKSAITGNNEVYAEALDLLQELHRRQAQWFNSQEFARDSALAEGDDDKAGRIAEFTKGVFSNMEDSRYYLVRKW